MTGGQDERSTAKHEDGEGEFTADRRRDERLFEEHERSISV